VTAPNIRPAKAPHSECWRLDWADPLGTRIGDVRYCPHGRVQVRTKTSPQSRMQGPGTDWWRTLSPFWNPALHRRAKEALDD
jgi:hypothetical protein